MYYKHIKIIKNFSSLVYSYKKYQLLTVLNSFLSTHFIFGIYKKFTFFLVKKQLKNNSYIIFKNINNFLLKFIYNFNKI